MKNRIPFENGKSALRKSVPIDGSLGLMKITGAPVKGHPSAHQESEREDIGEKEQEYLANAAANKMKLMFLHYCRQNDSRSLVCGCSIQ
jgi:hypothetical protein